MSAATSLARLVAPVTGGQLPVRIRAWDGSETGPVGAPTLHITSGAHCVGCWQPNELGLAQAYVTGELDVPGGADDLAEGLRRVWQNVRSASLGDTGAPEGSPALSARQKLSAAALAVRLGAVGRRPTAPSSQAVLRGGLHTQARDKAAIAHHYDLSNEFYSLILDASMAYSCAYYSSAGLSLEQAQTAKLDLICRKLGLQPGMRLLDVGCGWGSLSLHAAQNYGVRVLGVTLSQQQHDFIAKQIAERNLSDRVEVRVQDYRAVAEPAFDAVSSIEMGEHVGEHNYPTYAATLFGHLKPTGRLLLQQMSRRADAAPGGGPFIESFIAPDMHMRPVSATLGFLEQAGLEIREVHALREHYVRTVRQWLETFEAHYDEAVAMVGEEVARVWRLYLVGGGLVFEEGRMGVDQILAVRPTAAGGVLHAGRTGLVQRRMSSGFAAHKFFQNIPLVAVGLLVVLTITYLASRRAGRHNVVDTAWGLLYVTAALISFLASSGTGNTGRRLLLLVMTAAWGLRLAVHIGRRGLGKGEDPRYAKMLANRGQLQTIAVVYGLQGVLAMIISAPLQVGAFEAESVTPLAYLGVLIWLVGLIFEGVGDWQMEQFKKAKASGESGGVSASGVMDRGLWRFTRHPNYFGDACVWVGLFLVAAERWPGILTVFAPAIMIYLLAFGSGKRVLERSMAERAGYRDYMKRTSGFIPLPPRRVTSEG